MAKLKQSFINKTDVPQFINLELSLARYRLGPDEELVLFYDPDRKQDRSGSALIVEFIVGYGVFQIVVWTSEVEMFFPDGRPAPQNFELS